MTMIVGIIGFPLKHTISPVFQQAAFDHLHLDIRYEAWETEPQDLGKIVEQLRGNRYLGMNVTVPFKEVVMPLLDKIDDLARRIGAVNTVANRAGLLVGFNTDAAGFLRALRAVAGFEPGHTVAVILGSGGAARAVAFALADAGARRIYIVNRTLKRAEALVADLALNGVSGATVFARPWTDAGSIRDIIEECDLIVNTTSVGMKHGPAELRSPLEAGDIPSRALVYDIVYNPGVTPLLVEATKAGARTLGGLPMLVYQGAAALELWTGKEAPVGLMLAKAQEALARG
ncbi:MAG: shikimate dehydrogenase [Dehalococcoidia bacterium]|nr:shikimate dehydrogenase [Dehalococcoidia bacterium]